MAYITLEEVKDHLRVDYNTDDTYITSLINLAESVVAVEIEDDLSTLEDESDNIPIGLKHAMLLMIGHFYAVREPILIGVNAVKVPFGFEFLIAPYKNWVIGKNTETVSVTSTPVEPEPDIDYLYFTSGTFRMGERDGFLCIDKVITLTGFDGVEDTDWGNIHQYNL